MKRHTLIAPILALCGLIASTNTLADTVYPERPIKLLIPFSAGGSTDVFGRKFANELSKRLNQTIVVENKDGAAGSIAGADLAGAAPDGYTLMIGTSSNVTSGPATNQIFRYDPREDFEAIGLLGIQPIVLITHPNVPANNFKEFIELVQQKPQDYSYGTGGIGGITHLTAEFFKNEAGDLSIQHVPYKGSAPAIHDLLAGRIQVLFDSAVPNIPHYRAGKQKILATFHEKRLEALPDIPTTVESGYPNLLSATVLFFVAPANTPESIIEQLRVAANDVVRSDAFRKEMAQMGIEHPGTVDAASAQKYIADDIAKWERVAKSINLKLE